MGLGDRRSQPLQLAAGEEGDSSRCHCLDSIPGVSRPVLGTFSESEEVLAMENDRSLGTSIMFTTPAQLEAEFGVTTTQSILPVSMYVFALALGPVGGGPLSETVGRLPVFTAGLSVGRSSPWPQA